MIQKYIIELLYQCNCVIVPQLGGFITRYISADIHSITNKITPPSKEIAFNDQLLQDDNLLIDFIAAQENIDRNAVTELILKFVAQTKEDLEKFNTVLLEGIGRLIYNKEQKIEFIAQLDGNILEDSFGLGELFLKPIEPSYNNMERIPPKTPRSGISRRPPIKKDETKVQKLKREAHEDDDAQPQRTYRTAMMWGIVLVLLTVTGTTFYFNKENQSLASMFPFFNKSTPLNQEATANSDAELVADAELADNKLEVESPVNNKKFHIVVGSFTTEANAQKMIEKSTDNPLKVLNPEGGATNYRVSVAAYETKAEARADLKKIKSKFGKGAWVLYQ